PETRGSQVIVHGKVWAPPAPAEYYRRRDELWGAVEAGYRRLAAVRELVIIEGAGSPAEPNLMARDLTNMAIARLARAPVLLVGDIDRGGVFAALLGTLALLPAGDRRRVKGFIINKFRGDPGLLAPAISFLQTRSRRPVLGVVPYLQDLRLPEEDSVALEGPSPREGRSVAVVRLPHIANFTDFDPLALEPGTTVRYVHHPDELAGAGLILVPGSKDTLADLRWLRVSGFAEALVRHVEQGGALGGICGGYQMLGLRVEDPERLEGGGAEDGLGLLPVVTTLAREKITRRVRARLAHGGPAFEAYEIHLGRTAAPDRLPPFALIEEGGGWRPDGAVSREGRVWGTYLHGLFDAGSARRAILERHLGRVLGGTPAPDYRELREQEYDRLAEALGSTLDLPALFALAGLSAGGA
ncbi:MAG: cobyric acid synthase, partial [Candidatus Rokubacteria bacterium]|nr:cobyric acid synthase [Candidatus Rokubacteria bacterium]